VNIDIYNWVNSRPVTINHDIIKKYYNALKKAEKDLGVKNSFDISVLLPMDGVIQRDRVNLSERSKRDLFKTLDRVIKMAQNMRNREGLSVKADLKKSISNISSGLKKITGLSGDSSKKLYDRLKNSIESISQKPVDDNRLYTEIAILADKIDTNEERVRLADHLNKFSRIIAEKGQIGKQLDFLAQEMFREINTISSKCNDSRVSHIVVDMKNHIDKIREQCRNII
jgi:uncharacterized protein (TIGR00255 family)